RTPPTLACPLPRQSVAHIHSRLEGGNCSEQVQVQGLGDHQRRLEIGGGALLFAVRPSDSRSREVPGLRTSELPLPARPTHHEEITKRYSGTGAWRLSRRFRIGLGFSFHIC